MSPDWEVIAGGMAATLDLFSDRRSRPTAIFYANSMALLGGYKAIRKLNLSIPADVAVVSFDPPYVIDSLSPIPTTLGQFEAKIGSTASKMLYSLMTGVEVARKEVRVRSTIRTGHILRLRMIHPAGVSRAPARLRRHATKHRLQTSAASTS